MSWREEITNDALEGVKIAKLRDRPNMGEAYGASGMSAKELKEYFDKATELLAVKINDLIEATDPDNYSGKIVIDYNGIGTLADLIRSLENGEFANKVLVKIGENDPVSIASAFGTIESNIDTIESNIDTKVTRVENSTSDFKVYGERANKDGPGMVSATLGGGVGTIPVYGGNASEATTESVLVTGDPQKDYHAANKRYVDGLERVIRISYNSTTGEITLTCMDEEGDEKEQNIDLPIEEAFKSARYEEETNKIIFTTQSGGTVEVPLGRVIGGIITPENLAQDLEGNADNKAVSQAAVKAAVDDLKGDYEDLSADVTAQGTALEGKVDKEALYEEWQTANVLDPSLAEEGYYINVDIPEFAPSDGWNNHLRLPKDKAISWGDNTSVYIRTSLPNTSEYSGVQICVIQIDGSGLRVAHNVFSFSNITSDPEGKEYQKKNGATHFVLYTTGRSLGVSFNDWCLSFEPLAQFVAFQSGTRIKESDIIITTPPTEDYHPVPKGYFDEGLSGKLNAPAVIPARGNDYVYIKTWDDKYEFRKASPQGSGGEFLQYGVAANIGTAQWTYGQIAVGNPVNPYNAAPKIYVDNKIRPIEIATYAALGTIYEIREDTSVGFSVPIPENALRGVYIESFGEAHFINSNGEEIGSAPVTLIRIGESYFRDETPQFIQMPEGAEFIEPDNLTPPEGTEMTEVRGRKIIFQLKVGG